MDGIVKLFGVLLAIGLAGGVVVGVIMIAKALASRLEGPRNSPPLEEFEARMDELDSLKERMAELEERMDFSERLLTRPAEGRES